MCQRFIITAVGVDKLAVYESDPEVVQHGGLVEIAESREVILAHQDVWITERGQDGVLWVQFVLRLLPRKYHSSKEIYECS